MQRMHSKPVHTFTIGLRSLYSEAKDAHAVARHLGTEHTEIYVTPEQAMEVVPLLPSYYDEPFADYSQIPMMLISQLTRHHVTVCLSGDGGDELFAGYDRVVWGQRIWRRFGWMPASVRRGIAAGLGQIPAQPMDRIVHAAQRLMPRNRRIPDVTGKAQKLASFLPAESADAMYYDLVSVWKDPALLLGPVEEPQNPVTDPLECAGIHDATERMLHRDIIMSLPDDMLQKVDRASMSVGLEVRVPFLDHRLVEFSWTLPLAMKMRARRSKWILRQVLHKHVPRKLIERPKQGFGVPMVDWLRGPMRDWAESLLDESVLRSDGILDPKPVRSCWSAHLAGRRNDHQQIWIILMFQAWLDENRPLTS
jgi:asparagine synthase (glutamine-hydrolysing)